MPCCSARGQIAQLLASRGLGTPTADRWCEWQLSLLRLMQYIRSMAMHSTAAHVVASGSKPGWPPADRAWHSWSKADTMPNK